MNKSFFTSESVTEGHPDKVCDQISDAVLDEIMRQDPMGRVACEVTATTGMVMIMGEITTSCYVDIPRIARDVIRDIGYNDASYGFDANTCAVLTAIDEQSPDIALGVDRCLEKKEGKRYVSWIVSLGEMPDLRPVGLVARVGAGTCRAGEKTA